MNEQPLKHSGFIPPVIDKTHHILGDANPPFAIVNETGDWSDYLPIVEKQNVRNIETFNCSGFNTLNDIEMLMFKLFSERVNYSDRWLGIIAGTKYPGNDPHVVAEAIRKYGLIPEEMLPFSDEITSVEDYYSFKGADKDACYKAGEAWTAKYDFKHKWVFNENHPEDEKINNMKVALKSSPLGIAVYAWASNEQDVYYSMGDPNHWTDLYRVDNFLEVFDDYDPVKKKVQQNIPYAKVYSISIRPAETQKKMTLLQQLIRALLEMLGIAQKQEAEQALVTPPKPPVVNPEPIIPQVAPLYLWGTKDEVRHSVRLICDEEGLSVIEKNKMCATIQAESGFILTAKNENKVNGKTVSTDWGLCQWNDYYHKGEITPDEAVNKPEKAVRLMCAYWKQGEQSKQMWIAYKNGSYRQFL